MKYLKKNLKEKSAFSPNQLVSPWKWKTLVHVYTWKKEKKKKEAGVYTFRKGWVFCVNRFYFGIGNKWLTNRGTGGVFKYIIVRVSCMT